MIATVDCVGEDDTFTVTAVVAGNAQPVGGAERDLLSFRPSEGQLRLAFAGNIGQVAGLDLAIPEKLVAGNIGQVDSVPGWGLVGITDKPVGAPGLMFIPSVGQR